MRFATNPDSVSVHLATLRPRRRSGTARDVRGRQAADFLPCQGTAEGRIDHATGLPDSTLHVSIPVVVAQVASAHGEIAEPGAL